jgi:hypothetical protein
MRFLKPSEFRNSAERHVEKLKQRQPTKLVVCGPYLKTAAAVMLRDNGISGTDILIGWSFVFSDDSDTSLSSGSNRLHRSFERQFLATRNFSDPLP